MGIFSLGASALGAVGGSKIKLVLIVIAATIIVSAAAGAALYVRSLKSDIVKLRETNAELVADNHIHKENNAVLKENMKKLATANHTNWLTAQSLISDKALTTKALSNLAAMRTADKQSYDRLSKRIEDMLKDPANDGPVAPVLREVLREIQKERGRK